MASKQVRPVPLSTTFCLLLEVLRWYHRADAVSLENLDNLGSTLLVAPSCTSPVVG
ncbi:hypothetical protein PISMIDRAFT_683551, partial [Pisolithus microcarpus 441]